MNVANKKKSLVPIYAPTKHDEEKKQRRPRSSVRAIDNEGGGIAKESGSKRRPKTSTIRYHKLLPTVTISIVETNLRLE